MSAANHPAEARAPLGLLLVDDHGLFREGLSRLLAEQPGIELRAQCCSVEELRRAFADRDPPLSASLDLMLLDFDLGEQTGLEALDAARACGFTGKVLMVTAGMAPSEMVRAFDAGVSGVFLKHSPPGELVSAIHQVVRGEPWPDLATVAQLIASEREAPPPARDAAKAGAQPITARERAVLRGVFAGRANKEIAAELELSEGSVKAVLQQLFAKTGVRTRAQLVRIALENRYEYQLEEG